MQGKLRATAVCASAPVTPQRCFQAANPVLSPLKHARSPLQPSQEPHFRTTLCSQDRHGSCPGSHHTQDQETAAPRRRQGRDSATSIPAGWDAGDSDPKRGKHKERTAIGGTRTNPFLVAQNSAWFPLLHEQKGQVLHAQERWPPVPSISGSLA